MLVALVTIAVLAAGTVAVVLRTGGSTAEARVNTDGLRMALGDIRIEAPPGVAPVGTLATMRIVTEGPSDPPFLSVAAAGATAFSLDLDGAQPQAPITISFPAAAEYTSTTVDETTTADDVVPVVLSGSGPAGPVRLEPASYDPDSGRVEATVDHLTWFWEWPAKAEEFATALGAALLLGDTPEPECHGEPVTDGVGRLITMELPARTSVWTCLRTTTAGVAVDLTNTTPAPFELRAAPVAALQRQDATDVADALVLALIPLVNEIVHGSAPGAGVLPVRGSATYDFAADSLPAQIALRTDPAAYLVSVFGSVLDQVSRIADLDLAEIVLANASALDCISGTASTANAVAAGPPEATEFGEGIVAMLACLPPILTTLGTEIGNRGAFAVYLLLSGAPQLAGGVAGILGQVLGPQNILIEYAPPDTDPCSSIPAFEAWIRVLDPDLLDDGDYRGVATPDNGGSAETTLRCIDGHAVAILLATTDTDGLQAVIRPVEGYWDLATFPPGENCAGLTEYTAAVEAAVCVAPDDLAGERGDLWARWLDLNEICRGGPPPDVDPATDRACIERDDTLRVHFELSVAEFLAAWQRRDGPTMATLTHPDNDRNTGRLIPDDLLSFTPFESSFGGCRYDVEITGDAGCFMTVSEGGPGLYFEWAVDPGEGWLVRSYVPDV